MREPPYIEELGGGLQQKSPLGHIKNPTDPGASVAGLGIIDAVF
jgi:hypothetical protein